MPNLAHLDILQPQQLGIAAARQRPGPMRVLRAFARLKPGVSVVQARGALDPLFTESLNFVPAAFRHEVRPSLRTLREYQMASARLLSWVLFGAVLAVLLIACVDVANLFLARGVKRERELA